MRAHTWPSASRKGPDAAAEMSGDAADEMVQAPRRVKLAVRVRTGGTIALFVNCAAQTVEETHAIDGRRRRRRRQKVRGRDDACDEERERN